MAWPDEILDARSESLASAILALISAGPRWRHRRVETVTPVSATSVRRRVSIDLTVPPNVHDGLRLPVEVGSDSTDDQWVVPLAWLARRQLVSFDLRDERSRALPLLLGAQTAAITQNVLFLAALDAGLDPQDEPRTTQVVDVVLAASSERAPEDAPELVQAAREVDLGDTFSSLVQASAAGFLLLAIVDEIAGRRVIKWQTDELRSRRRPSPEPVSIDVEVPGINEASSSHVELELPDALSADSFHLFDARIVAEPLADGKPRRRLIPLAHEERPGSFNAERPRLLLRPVPHVQGPVVSASIVISPGRFLAPALSLSLLACLITVAGLASGVENVDPKVGPTSPSLLLGAFSVGFGLFLRIEEHGLVRSILGPARTALGLTALALGVAAIPLALTLSRGWILGSWIAAAVVSVGALGVIFWTIMSHTQFGRVYG